VPARAFFGCRRPNSLLSQERALPRLTRVSFRAQVLESVIKYRWMALPTEQREGIKNYIATVVIKVHASRPGSLQRSG
jgi:hypothetical protein